ncbi:MAG TPA: hypothetical protein VL171_10470 [Verrucomicrobiae bacterium]|nr:hypothetical protein [Verrucomicrobiae bacterium]
MKIKPTIPLVALSIELLAMLLVQGCVLGVSGSYALIGVATAACLVSLIGSVALFRQQVVVSIFCILVSMSAVFPTLFALATQRPP